MTQARAAIGVLRSWLQRLCRGVALTWRAWAPLIIRMMTGWDSLLPHAYHRLYKPIFTHSERPQRHHSFVLQRGLSRLTPDPGVRPSADDTTSHQAPSSCDDMRLGGSNDYNRQYNTSRSPKVYNRMAAPLLFLLTLLLAYYCHIVLSVFPALPVLLGLSASHSFLPPPSDVSSVQARPLRNFTARYHFSPSDRLRSL